MFDLLGSPSTEDWPEVEDLPNYLPFQDIPAKDLADEMYKKREAAAAGAKIGELDPQAIDLLSKLLTLNPKNRITP
jgi:hypothetical protein